MSDRELPAETPRPATEHDGEAAPQPAVLGGVEAWEDEGGASTDAPRPAELPLTGSPAQVEWAERIRLQVNAEFDRVAGVFSVVAASQSPTRRALTHAALAILQDKRAEVMLHEEAGYFIRRWQETGDQVRWLIFEDPRYRAALAARAKQSPKAT